MHLSTQCQTWSWWVFYKVEQRQQCRLCDSHHTLDVEINLLLPRDSLTSISSLIIRKLTGWMMMNILFSVILCMLAASIRVAAECETFTSSCPIALGQSLHYTFGINYVKLGADDDYYVTFTVRVTRVIHSSQLFCVISCCSWCGLMVYDTKRRCQWIHRQSVWICR